MIPQSQIDLIRSYKDAIRTTLIRAEIGWVSKDPYLRDSRFAACEVTIPMNREQMTALQQEVIHCESWIKRAQVRNKKSLSDKLRQKPQCPITGWVGRLR